MSIDASARPVPLSTLRRGARAVVHAVLEDTPTIDDALRSTVGQRLIELGFVHGVEIEIIEAMWPHDDPLAVRVRGSTFALRRTEAAAVMVTPLAAAA
ncbi:MAG: ferrous iron transport protein A [Steroidobacteraceae bacterium]|nr:ferrous iron transport protein A [Steroidobacteraceae bacterium]